MRVTYLGMIPEAQHDRLLLKLPKLKNGFLVAGLLLLSEMVWGVQRAINPYSKEAGGYAAATAVILSIVGSAFILHCISVYHSIANEAEGWQHRISARRAVAFHFIPIFNLYWNFRWPSEIARFVNWRTQKHLMSGVLVGSGVLAGVVTAALVDVALGLTIIFLSFAYISRCVRDALLAPPVPAEMHIEDRSDYATNMIG